MCSYQNITEANFGNSFSKNWEDIMWENTSSPYSHVSDSSYSQISDAAGESITVDYNIISTSKDYQLNTSISVEAEELPSSSPASWKEVASVPQRCTTMSTYFSTFNPSQTQDVVFHLGAATNNTTTNPVNVAGRWNKPQAQINVVPSKNGSFKAIVKRKRKRTIFTTEQIQVLEDVYSKKPYVTRDERQLLVQLLQVNDKSVKIWFQNRRLKNKRIDSDETEITNQCSIYDRIDTIESKIKERTNEFGYVTLDDKIVNELVNVIDDYFTSNISSVDCKNRIDDSPIYEPISPASTSDYSCEENSSAWQHYDPSGIVQELMDIESIITS